MSDDTNKTEELSEEVVAFVEEAGLVAFESALIRYLAEAEEETAEIFEKYIEAHSEDDSFIDDLCKLYPDFGELLKEEVAELQSDLEDITNVPG